MAGIKEDLNYILGKLREGKCIAYRVENRENVINIRVLEGDTPGEIGTKMIAYSKEAEIVEAEGAKKSDEAFAAFYRRHGVTPWTIIVPGDEEEVEMFLMEVGYAFGIGLDSDIFGGAFE